MALKVLNTMTKKKESFKPIDKNLITMYNCGLTVYNYGHIGNFRAYVFADILRRYLEWKGFKVKQVMNFTDVGHMTVDDTLASETSKDKMEKAAEREHRTPWEIAEFYIKAFLEDSKKLNLKEPHVRPRATDHIKEMQQIIGKLIEKGYAYISNGSVYYNITKFKGYGKLSGNTIEKLKEGAGGRVEENPDKKNPFDFALWINDPKHIMKWKSPWCEWGYPGWHIECSAMSMKYLGKTLDIHTGGVDNIFPHHDCEIAQSEAYTEKKFVNYWMHTTHLLVNGQKMSKSLGNFYTLRDLTEKGYDPKAVRYVLLSTNYKQQLNFTFESLDAAKKTIDGLFDFMGRLANVKGNIDNKGMKNLIGKTKKEFESAMDDNLNISAALASMFSFITEINKLIDGGKIGKKNAKDVIKLMLSFDNVLGLDLEKKKEKEKLPEEAKELINQREKARKKKDFETADKIRKELEEKFKIILEDTEKGAKWKKI